MSIDKAVVLIIYNGWSRGYMNAVTAEDLIYDLFNVTKV